MPRPTPQEGNPNRPKISYVSGKQIGSREVFSGFFTDVGLDDDLDAAAEAAGLRRVTMAHMEGGEREHWLFPDPFTFVPVTTGLLYSDIYSLVRYAPDVAKHGIVAVWPKGSRSRLQLWVIVPELFGNGYREALPLSVRSTQTEDLLTVLLEQNALLDQMEAAALAAGKPRNFEFWEITALVTASDTASERGKEQASRIYPMVSAHPTDPGTEYLRGIYTQNGIRRLLNDQDFWDDIIEQATQAVQRSLAADEAAPRQPPPGVSLRGAVPSRQLHHAATRRVDNE